MEAYSPSAGFFSGFFGGSDGTASLFPLPSLTMNMGLPFDGARPPGIH